MLQNSKGRYAIRVIAGGYLIYLAYKLIRPVIEGKSGGHAAVNIVAAIAFIAIGAVILYYSLKDYKAVKDEEERLRKQHMEEEKLRKEEERQHREELLTEKEDSDPDQDADGDSGSEAEAADEEGEKTELENADSHKTEE